MQLRTGDLTLHNLHLKKSAVEKYNLPVEVVEGHIGHLHITIPWFSLRTNPVHIQISDVFLLVKMKDTSSENANPAEDEKKEQEAKQERLRNAESLDAAAAAGQGAAGQGEDGICRSSSRCIRYTLIFDRLPSVVAKQTWLGAFTQKLVDNVQISIENIHLRYEDNLSTPEVSRIRDGE
jgi:vacuolar protein sorting-associated protein 13A/C